MMGVAMGRDFSIMDRLNLAFEVITRWETLVTLLAFVIFWLLVRYVANPWSSENRPKFKLPKKRANTPPVIVEDESEASGEDDGMLPD
jgi:hypothetical protein